MKTTNQIIFDHHKKKTDGGAGYLEIRITVDRRSYYIGTGIKVRRSEFVAGRIVNCMGAAELNNRLAIIYEKVCACVNDAIDSGAPINPEDIRQKVWKTIEVQSDEPTFLIWINAQIPKLDVKPGTRKHYISLQNRLKEYGKLRRWSDVTVEGIMNFDAWLHALRPDGDDATAHGRLGEGLSDAAIYNYHKCLKALLRRADLFGKIERNPYERLRGQFKRGDRENVEFLTEDEMHTIVNLDLPPGTLMDDCRDLFTFQMFTGLAYSDAQAFDIDKYKQIDGRWVFAGERIKTGVPYVSSLLPPVVTVLEKHRWRVPKIENHVYNRMLKALGIMAGIKTPLHSHLARHTFATWMLTNGARFENVGRMLGHKNITQTQRYAKVLAQSVHDDFDMVAEQMKKGR